MIDEVFGDAQAVLCWENPSTGCPPIGGGGSGSGSTTGNGVGAATCGAGVAASVTGQTSG